MSSEICPDNSQSCLLRAIIDTTQPGYNWNPLNFAFTAALSILAFLVAVIGLMQALFAAGPGRLKASRGALGPVYHSKAQTRWDRTELRFRTTANVPVIDIKSILMHCHPPRRGRLPQPPPEQALAADPVAGWALLLHELNITHIPFDMTYVLTDYLPGDILAAPALASVESLVILALMRGCNVLRVDADEFLTAIGPSMQLDFQTHPTMGSIGSYRHFAHGTQVSTLTEPEIRSVIHEARGHITFDDDELLVPIFRPGASMECRLIYEPLAPAMDKALRVCHHRHYYCTSLRKAMPNPDCQALFSRDTYNSRDISIFAAVLIGDAPIAAKVFPTNGMQLNRLLNGIKNTMFSQIWEAPLQYELEQLQHGSQVILLQEVNRSRRSAGHVYFNFTMHDCGSWAAFAAPESEKDQDPEAQHYERVKFLHTTDLFQDSDDPEPVPADWIMLNAESCCLRLSVQATSCAFSWLADRDYFFRQNEATVESDRKWLRFQIAEFDWFLAVKGGNDSFCACANLIYRTPYVLTSEDGDPVTEARPTYIRCKAKFLLPETLDAYQLPWEWDQTDPSYVIIKQYIDHDLQNELFEHTAAIILNRRNATTAWKSNWSFHTASAKDRSTKTLSSNNEIFPGEASDHSAADLSGRLQRRRRSASVSSWNDNLEFVPGTPPPASAPSSHWSAPSYGLYQGHRRSALVKRTPVAEWDSLRQGGRSLPASEYGTRSRHSSVEDIRRRDSRSPVRASEWVADGDVERRLVRYGDEPLSGRDGTHDRVATERQMVEHSTQLRGKSPTERATGLRDLRQAPQTLHRRRRSQTPRSESPVSRRSAETLPSEASAGKVPEHGADSEHNDAHPPLTRHAIHLFNVEQWREKHMPDANPDTQAEQGPASKENTKHHEYASTNDVCRPGALPEKCVEGKADSILTSSTKGEVKEAPDPHMKAMETLLFFRAVLVATLLASGADSTLLLKSEKRQQVVQVL